jgi:hypothetical protein
MHYLGHLHLHPPPFLGRTVSVLFLSSFVEEKTKRIPFLVV